MKPTRKSLALEWLESRQLLAAVGFSGNLSGQVGALVSAPVSIDSATGVRAATIRIHYDPAVLTLSQENVTAGSAWSSASDTQVTTNVDQATGVAVVFLSASTDLTSTNATLVQFSFIVRSGAAAGTVSQIDLTEVRLNEGAIAVNPLPIPGTDSTDGSITVSSPTTDLAAKITGFVYADSNQDSLVSSFEGISGCQVTLVNVSTGSKQVTTTGADGGYQFTNLAAGNFRIEQSQPNAFIDGSQNQLLITLTSSQSLTNQNFREAGFKPIFISNRLLTTLVMPVGSTNWQNSVSQTSQLTDSAPALKSFSAASTDSNLSPSNLKANPILSSSTLSLPAVSQAEGEAIQRLETKIASSQPASLSVPQLIKRSKAKGDAEIIDSVIATTSSFE
jgi:Cohesin domain/SdrD B-like domain